MNKPESPRLWAAAAGITLLSGAVMMLAGYVGHTDCWAIAGLIAIPGGSLILAALALARKAGDGHRHPPARTDSRRGQGAGVVAVTLVSGGVMVLAGYAGSESGWGLAAMLALVGGVVVSAAFALDRHQPSSRG